MSHKPHLEIEHQIELLESRGLQIPDHEIAASFLHRFNYYRFAEYTFAFVPEESRLQGTMRFSSATFSDVLSLIEFDFGLRTLLFEELSRFEIKLRTALAYVGGLQDPNFHITGTGLRADVLSLSHDDLGGHASWLNRYAEKIQGLSKEDKARNFELENTSEIPIWGAVELMDLGQLSRLYRMTDQGLSSRIADVFGCNPALLKSWISSFNTLRNYVAHQSRIWNRSFPFPPKTNSERLPMELLHLRGVKSDINLLYPRVAILAWFGLHPFLGPDFKIGLKDHLKSLPLHEAISPKIMGFPDRWRDLDLWK